MSDELKMQKLSEKELSNISGGAYSLYTPYVIDYDRCVSCGACVEECPVGAARLSMDEYRYMIDEADCVYCGVCETECPAGAIHC